MKKNHKGMLGIIVLATILILIGSFYAYFVLSFKDERTSDDNGNGDSGNSFWIILTP